MASNSASRFDGVSSLFKSAATTLYSDNQSMLAEIRKTLILMKEIGVDLEKGNQSELVKELESAVVELLDTYEDCTQFSLAAMSAGNNYQPGDELPDFEKLLKDEIAKAKATSSSDSQNHPMIRQFREAIWHVHHAGQPMPGEEQEDMVMTGTQGNILNITCPLSGKPVIELQKPIRSVACKHIYEKSAVMLYMKSKHVRPQCPVAGCPKYLEPGKLVSDPLLLCEIDEMRTMAKQSTRTDPIEDFTALDEEEEEEED